MNLGCLHSSAVEGELQDVPLDSLNSPEVTLPNTLSPMTSPSFCRTLSAPSSCTLESRLSLIRSRTHVKHSSSTANEHCSDITTSDRHNKTSLNLPSLEDGLSSGSDTEDLGDLSDTWPPVRTGVVSSCTPTSLKSASLIPPTSVAADFSRGSLVHPPVVQDIWGIMNELKQTLADDHANLNKPVYAPGTHLNCSRSACNDRSSGSTSADFKVPQRSSQPEASYSSPSTATSGSTLSDRGTCSKLIVQASVEHTLEEPPSVRSLGHSDLKAIHPTVSGQTYPTFPSPPTERSAHQWSFPIHSNTVYSSSEDELRTNVSEPGCKPVDVKQQRTLRELASGRMFSTPVSNPRAVTSINTTPTGLLCANRPRSMLPNHLASRRDGNPVTVFRSSYAEHSVHSEEFDSDEDTDQLLERQYQSNKSVYIPELKHEANAQAERRHQMREVSLRHPDFPDSLINGVLFRARYLGSTQLTSERQPTRQSRMFQAQEAVARVKAPDGESQPSVPVEFFVSIDRLMLLNPCLQDVLIDHELRTVSYVADIGDLFILMARKLQCKDPNLDATASSEAGNYPSHLGQPATSGCSDSCTCATSSTGPNEEKNIRSASGLSKQAFSRSRQSPTKLICHVLESPEARLIAQSVGHVFQLAYLDFLRENGVEDLSSVKHLNYEDVANQQEIFCDELSLFSDKERHKQITIPKQCGEPLGVVIVSSGWGSLLPTALLANMNPTGPACRSGQLNIGNHIISVNGQSLVGLPLEKCQRIIKACRKHSSVRLVVVDCPPVVEVLIRRPHPHYQLGFSVQDGMICSLLRGGIAERGGIRVDHRIIEINGQSVVAVSHEKIVQLLSSSVGEIHIRTMPTSVFRLLTGQETPCYI